MLVRLVMRLLWFTTRKATKYVLVPLVVSAATAAAVTAATDKIREHTPQVDGKVDPVIRPEP